MSLTVTSQEMLWDVDDVVPADVLPPKYENGGLDKFYAFVRQSFDMKKVLQAGNMVISFTINTSGEMKNIRIVKSPNNEAAIEMIGVLRKASKWEPASRGGSPISITMRVPFKYSIKTKPIVETDVEIKDSIVVSTTAVEAKPEYPGGLAALYKFVTNTYKPTSSKSGKILVSFIINTNGELENFKILQDIGGNSGNELIAVLKKCQKWKPGRQNGRAVRVQYNLPVNVN